MKNFGCRTKIILLCFLLITAVFSQLGCSREWNAIPVEPSLEDRMPDGNLFTPSTQSMLREKHWLETVEEISIHPNGQGLARVVVKSPERDHHLNFERVPLDYLVPRLHYPKIGTPDAFDALNLLLAEYSRNSLSMPVGKKGDTFAHFRTNLPEAAPWTLNGDYQFVPNRTVRPLRLSIINNCLAPGLWELSATDRAGELYHAWFRMPEDLYLDLCAKANGLPRAFIREALKWKTEPVSLDLDRLRKPLRELGETQVSLYSEDLARGFSTQDSRRKIAKGFTQIRDGEDWRSPQTLGELTGTVCRLTEFVEPGKYKYEGYREFDLRFLARTGPASITSVEPLTSYAMSERDRRNDDFEYLELRLPLGDYLLIVGNLPMQLLVPQEDFAINGFGVGVLSSGGLAERRRFLIEAGPAPSFAYLAKQTPSGPTALNSHEYGLEQIFIRTHLGEDEAWWEVTLTSYERIVDLVKYKVAIPPSLVGRARDHASAYISPIYFTYRDDNLR